MSNEVSIAGVRSPYLHHGPRDASEAVVFVHGNPGPKEDWSDLIAKLNPKIRAVAPDMPGFGAADRPRDFDYTVDGYAQHLGGILDALTIKTVHLVLHDFGGPWGLRWMIDHAERVASLTLVNIGVLRNYRWHSFARIWQTPILGELFQLSTSKAGLKMLLNRKNPKALPDAFFDRVLAAADWGHKRAVLKLYRATKDVAGLSDRLADRLHFPNLPTLVLWGDADPFLPSRYASAQKEFFPRATVQVLSGCGHWPFLDEPGIVSDHLISFLEAQSKLTARTSTEP